jgi:pimeloyl-ACP methyl ester carboxylesterase
MTTFVLIHGGGHGGWCWRWCAAALRAHGHEVYAPTLTGFGERWHLAAESFATFVTDIVNVVEFEGLDDVVLVGHSMGGVIVPRVAEAIPDRVARAVWLTAAVCNDGESLLQTIPQSPWIARAVTIGEDGTAHTDQDLILDANIHDATPEQRAFVHERHRPYPPHALVEPGRLRAFLALGVPTAYVFATLDRTIEPAVQERLADRLPGCRRTSVVAGHDCMVTQPEATAAARGEVAG